MKVVIVKEKGVVKILEGTGTVTNHVLGMRSREVKYYELDYDKSLGISVDAYIETLNVFPELLNKSRLIKEINF